MGELSQTFRKALAKEAGEILTLFSSGVMNSISARRRQALALRIMEIIRIKKLQPNLDLGGKTVEQAFGILEKAAQGRMIPLSRLIILEKSLQSGSTANLLAARPELGVISSMLSEFASFEQFVQTQHLVASP